MLAPAPTVMAEIVHGQGRTEVSFRRRGNWLRLLAVSGLFVTWLFGGLFAAVLIGAGSGDRPLMLVVWLAGWTIIGLLVLYMLLWRALGTETLIARPDSLTLMRRLLFIRAPVDLPAADITAIEWVADDPTRIVRVNGRRIPQSAITITAHNATLRCASGIAETEARSAIASLSQRLATARRRR